MKSFILGTANFGTRYGKIKNNYVNRNMANEIFDICLKNSINKIDTAPNYGNAQKSLENTEHINLKYILNYLL